MTGALAEAKLTVTRCAAKVALPLFSPVPPPPCSADSVQYGIAPLTGLRFIPIVEIAGVAGATGTSSLHLRLART